MSYATFLTWRDIPVATPELSIVIPTYNEEVRILPTLAATAIVVSGLGLSFEIIVSDDGSTDRTRDLVQALRWRNLRWITHANTGKGGAVRRGVNASRGQSVLFADADNSTPIEQLPQLIAALKQGADVVVGSRAAKGARVANKSALRQLVSFGLRTTVRGLTGLRIRDTQCGFKLFDRAAARTLFDLVRGDGFSFDLELLYLANKRGMQIAEIPVAWYDAPGSKVDTVRDTGKFLVDIARLRFDDLRGRYNVQPSSLRDTCADALRKTPLDAVPSLHGERI